MKKSIKKQSKKNIKSLKKKLKKDSKDNGGTFSSSVQPEKIYFNEEIITKLIRNESLKRRIKNFSSVVDNIIVDFTLLLYNFRETLRETFGEDEFTEDMYNTQKKNIKRENIEKYFIEYIDKYIDSPKYIEMWKHIPNKPYYKVTEEYSKIKEYIKNRTIGDLTL